MSRDVARMIYDMAMNDDRIDLKTYYLKTIEKDDEIIRLEKIIKNVIKTNVTQTKVSLNEYYDLDHIIYVEYTNENEIDENERIYCYKFSDTFRILIKCPILRDLIKNAIIPLQLKWYIEYDYRRYLYKHFMVDWSHWKK